MNVRKFVFSAVSLGVFGCGLWFVTRSMEHDLMDPGPPPASDLDSHAPRVKPSTERTEASPTEILKKLALLDSILLERNDNDSRLDTELKVLSREEKLAFIKRYKRVAREDRNARGLIVFLVGRNLTTPEDFQFLNDVFTEPYCRSLENCETGPKPSDEDQHHSSGDEVTLSYPQWAAIKAIEKWSENEQAASIPALRESAIQALKSGLDSLDPKIQSATLKLIKKLDR